MTNSKVIDLIPSAKSIRPLIEMFNACPICEYDTYSEEDKNNLLASALKSGYIIEENAINDYALEFVNNIDIKYNSTFYKTWSDVESSSDLKLHIEQLRHYMTVYGNDFLMYIPNDNPEEPEWTSYKIIKAITFEELYEKCLNMLCSGIALKSDTVKHLIDYIINYYEHSDITIDIDSIKNREALVILCDRLNILPKNANNLFAHIVYKATAQTMIVKNRALRKLIRENAEKVESLFMHLTESQKITLSTIFNRYKPLFVAFKTRFSAPAINRISHLSKKYHKPMKRGFWETILDNTNVDYTLLLGEAEKANNFKLIQVMQSIRERLLMLSNNDNNSMYVIRNNKIYIKDNNIENSNEKLYHWSVVYNLCKSQLVKNLSSKACTIKLPNNYELTCPTSEKNFIGNVPMGTSVKLGEHSVIGIYWRNSWGTHDFDLSFRDVEGNKIGWNSSYKRYDNSVMYSGDIVNAPHGANEVIYFKDDVPSGIFNVNRYNGSPGSKYKLFFGTDENYCSNCSDMENYVVDPNNLHLETEVIQGEMREQMIGMVDNERFYFYTLSTGNSAVSGALYNKYYIENGKRHFTINDNAKVVENLTNILRRKILSYVPLEEILLNAGFTKIENEDTAELDLTSLNRDTLINLFSNDNIILIHD